MPKRSFSLGTLLPWPRSFLGLLLIGFALIALPLVLALGYSAWSTERLTEQSRNAVLNAAQAARKSRSLVHRIGSVERIARQVAVLGVRPDLRADLDQTHRSFVEIATELDALLLDARQRSALRRTVEQEQELHESLALEPRQSFDAREIVRRAGRLADSATEVYAISHVVADAQVENLRVAAETGQRRVIDLALIGAAVALALALLLTRLIARPIAQIDASIRRLGMADFEEAVEVGGPADLRHLGAQLDWLRRRLVELEAQKKRFLRHLSHELKTPLTALREGTELLNEQVAGPLAPGQRQVVSIMRDNGVKLQRLIEDMLDYQRALHVAAALDLRPIALDELVREAISPHILPAKAKRLELVLDLAAASIEADAVKVRTIADNLIGNAVKFTPAGGRVLIGVREEGDEVLLDVIDSGPGVAPGEREAVFESFFRGRAKTIGRVEGTGLGLAIVREFVEAHGGRVVVMDSAGGAHFRVALPRRRVLALRRAA